MATLVDAGLLAAHVYATSNFVRSQLNATPLGDWQPITIPGQDGADG